MYSSGSYLKKRRDGSYSNSTKSMRVNGNLGYSYREIIFKTFFNPKTNQTEAIFNVTKFSPTTTGHQSSLKHHLEGLSHVKKIYNIDINSLNPVEFLLDLSKKEKSKAAKNKIEYFEKHLNEETHEVLELFGFNKKEIKEINKKVRIRLDEDLKNKKEAQSLNRLLKKVKHVDYASPENMSKALDNLIKREALFFDLGYGWSSYPEKFEFIYRALKLSKTNLDIFKKFKNTFSEFLKTKETLQVLNELGD